jgi:hypothetical protein
MLLTSTLALLFFTTPKEKPRHHIPPTQLSAIAKQIATEEGWPIDQKAYTFDPMLPTVDDGFDSIGLYRGAHLVRMYSVDRTTGDIVDFMRGCDVFRFEDLKPFQAKIKSKSHAPSLTPEQLAAKAGCPKLTVVSTRWVQ